LLRRLRRGFGDAFEHLVSDDREERIEVREKTNNVQIPLLSAGIQQLAQMKLNAGAAAIVDHILVGQKWDKDVSLALGVESMKNRSRWHPDVGVSDPNLSESCPGSEQ
jgi:hypothetical protein